MHPRPGWGAGGRLSHQGGGDGGSNQLTIEEVVARVELGELGHLRHWVAAGWRGADAGLGTWHARLPQPAGTWDPLSGRGMARVGGITPRHRGEWDQRWVRRPWVP